jgi:hypothetical protein
VGHLVLPKMATVKYYVEFARDLFFFNHCPAGAVKCVDVPQTLFESKASQLCLGLIEGLAYLQEYCIAHRDTLYSHRNIEVYNLQSTLKIIGFDIAIRAKDEN